MQDVSYRTSGGDHYRAGEPPKGRSFANVTETLNKRILELEQFVEKLKVSRDLDSKTSSKPPLADIIKKTETKQSDKPEESKTPKRRPGGQLGHPGKTRKGFSRIDRFKILRPEVCLGCGSTEFIKQPNKIEIQQVAQLVERPIEIVEYHRHTCVCQGRSVIEFFEQAIKAMVHSAVQAPSLIF